MSKDEIVTALRCCDGGEYDECNKCPMRDKINCRNLLDLAAAEVAPVVYCRECEHSYEAVGGRFCTYGVCVDCEVPDDFYCGNGKRGETGEG